MRKTSVKMNKPLYLAMSILDISKNVCINFGTNTLNQNMKTEQSCVTQILIALLFLL